MPSVGASSSDISPESSEKVNLALTWLVAAIAGEHGMAIACALNNAMLSARFNSAIGHVPPTRNEAALYARTQLQSGPEFNT
jgi:hypothetical protein